MFQTHEIKELKILLRSNCPIIAVESSDEAHVMGLFNKTAVDINQPLYSWDLAEGLRRIDLPSTKDGEKETTLEFLSELPKNNCASIYLLCDIHCHLEDARLIRQIKSLALQYAQHGHTLVLLSHQLTIPPEFRNYVTHFELSPPSRDMMETLVREEAAHYSKLNGGKRVKTDNRTLSRLIRNLQGIDLVSCRKIVRQLIYDNGAITDCELNLVNQEKFRLMDMDGVLHFEQETARFNDVGGLSSLKKWLSQRQDVFLSSKAEPGKEASIDLEPPKGVLLVGVQGGGKSLAAKAVAGAWGVPLLRLDFGALYNKFHGETERNLRQSLKLAELMRPCVLWIDEIEKGVSTQGSDGGTSRRVLGTLLTWMAERKQGVFLVATANDISQLPPELVRKGRMDEIFFIDLPDFNSRAAIFQIHLNKRGQPSEQIDLNNLADMSDGFTGAEIEHVVIGAMYASSDSKHKLSEQGLVEEIKRTRPLSVVMSESLAKLRSWAHGRTVNAD